MLEPLVDHKVDHNNSVGKCGRCAGSDQVLLHTSGLDRR